MVAVVLVLVRVGRQDLPLHSVGAAIRSADTDPLNATESRTVDAALVKVFAAGLVTRDANPAAWSSA